MMNRMISRSVILSTVAFAGILLLTRPAATQVPPVPPAGGGALPDSFQDGGNTGPNTPNTGLGHAGLTYGLGPPLPPPDPREYFRRFFGEQSTGGLNPVEPSGDSDEGDTTSGSTGGALPQEEPSSDTTGFTTSARVVDALDTPGVGAQDAQAGTDLERERAAQHRTNAAKLREQATQFRNQADQARGMGDDGSAELLERIAQATEDSERAELQRAHGVEDRARQRAEDATRAEARRIQQQRTEREQQQAAVQAEQLRAERNTRRARVLANNNSTAVARAAAQEDAAGHLNQDRHNAGMTRTQGSPLETSTGEGGIDMAELERKKAEGLVEGTAVKVVEKVVTAGPGPEAVWAGVIFKVVAFFKQLDKVKDFGEEIDKIVDERLKDPSEKEEVDVLTSKKIKYPRGSTAGERDAIRRQLRRGGTAYRAMHGERAAWVNTARDAARAAVAGSGL